MSPLTAPYMDHFTTFVLWLRRILPRRDKFYGSGEIYVKADVGIRILPDSLHQVAYTVPVSDVDRSFLSLLSPPSRCPPGPAFTLLKSTHVRLTLNVTGYCITLRIFMAGSQRPSCCMAQGHVLS